MTQVCFCLSKEDSPGHINLSVTNPLLHLRMNTQDPGSSIRPLFPIPMLLTGLSVTFWQTEEMLGIIKFGRIEVNVGDGVVS